jgi:hypothetical protein
MFKFIKSPKFLLIVVTFFLFIIPFFWLKPGEMDLGGDSNRLYYYDPINYLKNNLLYAINPSFGNENPLYLSLPFVSLLVVFKSLIPSSYFIITFINSLTLVIAFLAMFGITKHLFEKGIQKKDRMVVYCVSIFVGVYYILSPIMVRSAWDKALLTHLQIFLNPLVFFLFLRFFESSKIKYLLSILIITFIFSTNFSWGAAPPLLAFYPFALLFLLIYTKLILRKKIPLKSVIVFSILFLLIHSFHFAPIIAQVLGHTGDAYARSFTSAGKYDIGLNYFLAVANGTLLSKNLIGLPQMVPSIMPYEYIFIIFFLLFIIGLIINIKQKKIPLEQRYTFLLITVFFLISIFFATGNITKTGLSFYSALFNIPGFSMFRNYYGQWEFLYMFFMSLTFGYGVYRVALALGHKTKQMVLLIPLFLLILFSAIPFIRGDMINLILNKGQKIEFKVPIKMDPQFEQMLSYIRDIPYDGKFLLLPHTEAFNHMVAGTQGGMYQGPSMISTLTGKKDFAGYQVIKPFSELFLTLAKQNDKKDFITLLSLLNIRYIYYNSDPRIMDYYPDFPYSHVKDSLPHDQEGYKKFITTLPVTKKKDFGKYYHIYEIDKNYYLPHLYVAEKMVPRDKTKDNAGYVYNTFFSNKKNQEKRTVYMEDQPKIKLSKNIPTITFTEINPTKYYIHVTNISGPYALVFSDIYNPNWKLFSTSEEYKKGKYIDSYFNGQIKEDMPVNSLLAGHAFETLGSKPIADNNHYLANAYSNTWLIQPNDMNNKKSYTLILELTSQRLFYIFLPISVLSFLGCLIWFCIEVVKDYKNE